MQHRVRITKSSRMLRRAVVATVLVATLPLAVGTAATAVAAPVSRSGSALANTWAATATPMNKYAPR